MVRGASPAEQSAKAPERVGRFDLVLPIASGGMATVYLARSRGHGGFERDVALKLTHAHLRETEQFASELIEEAKLAVRIRHANVVSVLDVGDDPFGVFLVMEYVEGESLAGLFRLEAARGSRLVARFGLKILLDALAGLHAAHELTDEAGQPLALVHRDFSPQNILVGLDGVGRLADFGVAKAATRLGHTQTGLVKGKIAYMAPEQARDLPLDRRCDVWAAGVLAWELIAGRRLYGKKNDAAILLDLVTERAPLLSTVRSDVPPALDEAIARALAVAPDERWPTAQAFANALISACDGYLPRPEPTEVAEHVAGLVGHTLAERRRRASEILRLRDQAAELAGDPKSDIPSGSEVRARARSDFSLAPATGSTVESTDTTSVSGAPGAAANAKSAAMRRRFVWIASAALGGAAVIGLRALPRKSPQEAPRAAAPESSIAAPALPSDAPIGTSSAEPASTAEPSAPTDVVVTANASIASIQIGSRVVVVPAPTASITIPRSAIDTRNPVKLVARSVDGRRAELLLDAHAASAAILFTPRGTPAAASSKAPGSARLAKSPYESSP